MLPCHGAERRSGVPIERGAVQVDLSERCEGEQLLGCGLEQFGGFDVW